MFNIFKRKSACEKIKELEIDISDTYRRRTFNKYNNIVLKNQEDGYSTVFFLRSNKRITVNVTDKLSLDESENFVHVHDEDGVWTCMFHFYSVECIERSPNLH